MSRLLPALALLVACSTSAPSPTGAATRTAIADAKDLASADGADSPPTRRDETLCDCKDNDHDGLIDENCFYDLAITVTADDAFTVYLDGAAWGSDAVWQDAHTYTATVPGGVHHVAAYASDLHGLVAGFLAALEVDGAPVSLTGDGTWRGSHTYPGAGWQTSPFGAAPNVVAWTWPQPAALISTGAQWVWLDNGVQEDLYPENWFIRPTLVCGEQLDPCDGVDNDNDGQIDEGYPDTDLDGHADCVDPETCDGLDNDGDGLVDEGFPDTDGDGVADCVDVEICDGLDNDGDGLVDEVDNDGDGLPDCFDVETCDGLDNDGDGLVDEGFPDTDGDGVIDCQEDPCLGDGDGMLWVSASGAITTWDPVSGVTSVVDTTTLNLYDLAFHPNGTLYLLTLHDLWSWDFNTGTPTHVAAFPSYFGRGLSFDAAGTAWISGSQDQFTVDVTTGALTPLFTASGSVLGDWSFWGGELHAAGDRYAGSVQLRGLHRVDLIGSAWFLRAAFTPYVVGTGTFSDGRFYSVAGTSVYQHDLPSGTTSPVGSLTGMGGATGATTRTEWCNSIVAETCNGLDDDGDGLIDEGYPDVDGDGVRDCVDPEVCDCTDNDRDGVVDETCAYDLEVQWGSSHGAVQLWVDGDYFTAGGYYSPTHTATRVVSGGAHALGIEALWSSWAPPPTLGGLQAAAKVDGVLQTVTGDGTWLVEDGVPYGAWMLDPVGMTPAVVSATCGLPSTAVTALGAAWMWSPACNQANLFPENRYWREIVACGP
jgi:hypothetical protein